MMENINLNKLAEETADKYEKRGTEFWRGFHAGFIYGFNKCDEFRITNIDTESNRILSILNKYRIDGVNFQNEKTPLIHMKFFNEIINEILNMKKELYCSECQSITSHIIADVDTGNEDMPNYVKCYVCEKCGQTNDESVIISYDFEKDIKKIEHILPSHYGYKCELRDNSVHCYSETGIPDEEECFWRFFIILLKQSFGERFIEVFHQTCTNHKKFTVYLKKSGGKNF